MTRNAKRALLESGPSSENSTAVAPKKVANRTPDAQQEALFPVATTPAGAQLPVVRPLLLVTRGRVEYSGHCPGCDGWHRHIALGKTTGPCGARYELQPKRGRSRRAA